LGLDGTGPAQSGGDASQELLYAEGFGHIVIGTEVERRDLVMLAPSGGDHDDPDR
jgi:hypothetical protein